jgi:epoxyqueuosine reductase QueG
MHDERDGDETLAVLNARLAQACREDPKNRLPAYGGMRIYDDPLVGVAAAADPLYLKLKQTDVIGPQHMTPGEWLEGARSVVSYFLPFSQGIRAPNRRPGMVAAEWVAGRFEGEAFNNHLRDLLAEWIRELGGEAVVPCHTDRYRIVARRANWSERHTAFVAGLGTFGLSKSMFTARGSAGRFGSVITTLELPATVRDYEGPYDRCPWLANGTCGACIDRCPSGAIKSGGKDAAACAHYLDHVVKPLYDSRYGCGKCQTGVPCEAGIPKRDMPVLHRDNG